MNMFNKSLLSTLLISSFLFASLACAQNQQSNLLTNLSKDQLQDFKWMNPPSTYTINAGVLSITAEKETDFFNNPEDASINGNAPFLYKEVQGDFVAVARVTPDFSSQWNAVSLMLYIDEKHWIKFAFENSDATGKSIVTVVTKGVSDDANGVVLNDEESIWLKLVRKENIYSMLWSVDGKDYKMARLTTLVPSDVVKLGIEAQCPVGEQARHSIGYFAIDKRTVKDLRKGE